MDHRIRDAGDDYYDYPHKGDCVGSLCGVCGCCLHCDHSCVCADPSCGCKS